MSFTHSGIVDQNTRSLLEQQILADVNQWLSSWYTQSSELSCSDTKFHYSEELFQPPALWQDIVTADFYAVTSSQPACCSIYLDDWQAFAQELTDINKGNEFNEHDRLLFKNVAETSLSSLAQSINQLVEGTTEIEEPVVIAKVKINSCNLYFCLGAEYLYALQQKLAHSSVLPASELAVLFSDKTVQVEVNMQTKPLTFSELCQLKQGDVLSLEQSIKQPIAMKVAGNTIGNGYLVNKNNNKAMYLSGIKDES